MLTIYQALISVAMREFSDIVRNTDFIGGTAASPNKLCLMLVDDSCLDIWLSYDGDYAYHWEQRRQRGRLFRWDNAPHHPHVSTFPAHFHDGAEGVIRESHLADDPARALRYVLDFIRRNLD